VDLRRVHGFDGVAWHETPSQSLLQSAVQYDVKILTRSWRQSCIKFRSVESLQVGRRKLVEPHATETGRYVVPDQPGVAFVRHRLDATSDRIAEPTIKILAELHISRVEHQAPVPNRHSLRELDSYFFLGPPIQSFPLGTVGRVDRIPAAPPAVLVAGDGAFAVSTLSPYLRSSPFLLLTLPRCGMLHYDRR
jgi:hypothetical protein